MAQALLNTYEPISVDPVGDFLAAAATELHIDTLVEAFSTAIAVHRVIAHCCCALDESGTLIPLFGDNLALARADSSDLIEIAVETAEGEPLLVLMSAPAAVDRQTLSTLRIMATLYGTHGITLFDASDEMPVTGQITPTEQKCFSLTMAGWSYLDIGEHLDRSAPAIAVYLRRAARRLGVSTVAEASVIVASRGMLSQIAV